MEVHLQRTFALLSGKKGGVLFPLRGRSQAPGIWGPLETGGPQGKAGMHLARSLHLSPGPAQPGPLLGQHRPLGLGAGEPAPSSTSSENSSFSPGGSPGGAPFHRVAKLDMWSAPHDSQARTAEQACPPPQRHALKGFTLSVQRAFPISSIDLTPRAPLIAS